MRIRWRAVAAGLATGIVLGAGAAAAARDLGTREARDAIARLLGRSSGEVRIKAVSPGPMGGDAVVTAQMDTTFQLHQEKDGTWRVAAVRLSDGRWEDVELLRRALDAEKTERARADLASLATGTEAYRRDRGFYPEAETVAVLVDKITPRYLARVVRQDPWNQPYFGQVTAAGFRLGSAGPDGRKGTADDVVQADGGAGATR
jgi:hypothetical protein